MIVFSSAEKELWLKKLKVFNEQMELQFNDQQCLDFFIEFTGLRFTYLISQLEEWLLGIAQDGTLPIVYGLLAYWYKETEDWEKSQANVAKVDLYFPSADLWQDIFEESSFGEFLEQNDD